MPGTSLALPSSASRHAREALGLGPDEPLRLTYIPGPGDVSGTFGFWRRNRHDPRVPVVAYSFMFYDLVAALEAEAQILAFCPPPPEAPPSFRFEQVERRGWRGRVGFRLGERLYAREAAARVEAFRPHVVIASTDFPSLGWRRLARNRRLILSAHNTFWPMGAPPPGPRARLRRRLLSAHAAALDGAVCTSPECARQLATLTDGRVRGFVEHPQVVARHAPMESGSGIRDLLFLGRIEVDKGVFLLLDAFEALSARRPALRLTLAGSGSAEAALRARVAQANSPGLTYVGRLDSEGVHAAIRRADLIVCPTTRGFNEGLALVALEGAAHGVPTLMSSVVPARDLLGEGCAVFEADDAAALIAALDRLIEDPEACASMRAALAPVRERLQDRSLSWASQLYRALTAPGA